MLSDPCELTRRLVPKQWRSWLSQPWEELEEQMVARLRRCTRTGRPAGGESFIERLESLLGRVLRPKKGGRPRKPNAERYKGKQEQKHG